MSTLCGSPTYIAPEVLSLRGYTKACDMWSIGVIAYVLLCGYPPFYASSQLELFRKIRDCDYTFHAGYWTDVSDEAKNLVQGLICLDTNKRLSAKEALSATLCACTGTTCAVPHVPDRGAGHRWIQSPATEQSRSELLEQFAKNHRSHAVLRRAMTGAKAIARLRSIKRTLTTVFTSNNHHGEGEPTMETGRGQRPRKRPRKYDAGDEGSENASAGACVAGAVPGDSRPLSADTHGRACRRGPRRQRVQGRKSS